MTLSFVPYAANLQTWIDRARARGHEVLLELPMEPFDPDADDTGPQTLLASAPSAAEHISRLEQLLSRGAGYFGVTNYQGARFATSAQASQPVVQALRRRGLVFISSGIGQRTALSVEAQRAGLANTAADRIIDARREADAIDDQLLNLEALALQNQSAHRRRIRLSCDHGASQPLGAGRRVDAAINWPPHRPCSMHAPRADDRTQRSRNSYRPNVGLALFHRDGLVFLGKRVGAERPVSVANAAGRRRQGRNRRMTPRSANWKKRSA